MEQVRSTQILTLNPGCTFTPRVDHLNGVSWGAIRVGETGTAYLNVECFDVDTLLALADAAQEAARRLRASQIANENVQAVA